MSNVVTATEVKLAQALVAATEPMSQGDLAKAADIARSGVSVALRQFEEAGLVVKGHAGMRSAYTATGRLAAELGQAPVGPTAPEPTTGEVATEVVEAVLGRTAGAVVDAWETERTGPSLEETERAVAQLQAELTANAPAIAAIMNEPHPGDPAEAPAAIAVAVAVAPKAVAWPTLEEVVAGVQAHAAANYNAGGWDVLVETMDADEITAELAGMGNEVSLAMALAHYGEVAAVQADRQADALVEGETEKGQAKKALAEIKLAAKAELVARRQAVATEQEGYPAVKARALADKCHADYPAGYTSVMGLTHEINARGLYMGGKPEGLTGQSLYTYINANKAGAHPFPLEQGSKNGKARAQINLEAGLAWWQAKNERAAARGAKAEA